MRAACNAIVIWTLALLGAPAEPALAQASWNPFSSSVQQAPGRPPQDAAAAPSPADSAYVRASPWQTPRGGSVERGELAPIRAPDASGLPLELWQGLDLSALEGLFAGLALPPRSFALHQLWRRMLLSTASPPEGSDQQHFAALRLEALYRSGLMEEMDAVLREAAEGPIIDTLRARRDIGLGRREAGCQIIKRLSSPRSGLPGRLKGETQLLAGYCAAAAGDAANAGLAVELAREEGFNAELPLAVLASIAAADKPHLQLPARVLLLDYRFLELLGPVDALKLLDKAEPALLVALSRDGKADARLQIAAAEAALRLNALAPAATAEVYRRQPVAGAATPDEADPLLRRALFFRAIELSEQPQQRARFMRAMLDDAKRSELRMALARLIAPALKRLELSPELAWFAETASEVALSGGDFALARRWAQTFGLYHWLALLELVDPDRRGPPSQLAALEELAVHGRLGGEVLHRLATSLDALDVDVPIGLWDAAGRTPQPAGGYLPETGVLAELAQSAKRREVARTVLIVMRALGAYGPEGANVLAFGDGVRALKRVGLEGDARSLVLEALLGLWPRSAPN